MNTKIPEHCEVEEVEGIRKVKQSKAKKMQSKNRECMMVL